MGVGTGTGVGKGRVNKGLRVVVSGVAISALTLGFAACSSDKPDVAANATLQKALEDYRLGNTALAKTEFEAVVKANPNDKFAWYNLGVIAHYGGNASEASKNYLKSLAIDSHFQ